MAIDPTITFSPYHTRPASKQEQREQYERYLDELRDAFIEMQRRLVEMMGEQDWRANTGKEITALPTDVNDIHLLLVSPNA